MHTEEEALVSLTHGHLESDREHAGHTGPLAASSHHGTPGARMRRGLCLQLPKDTVWERGGRVEGGSERGDSSENMGFALNRREWHLTQSPLGDCVHRSGPKGIHFDRGKNILELQFTCYYIFFYAINRNFYL